MHPSLLVYRASFSSSACTVTCYKILEEHDAFLPVIVRVRLKCCGVQQAVVAANQTLSAVALCVILCWHPKLIQKPWKNTRKDLDKNIFKNSFRIQHLQTGLLTRSWTQMHQWQGGGRCCKPLQLPQPMRRSMSLWISVSLEDCWICLSFRRGPTDWGSFQSDLYPFLRYPAHFTFSSCMPESNVSRNSCEHTWS